MIKDSGERTIYDNGFQRDMHSGKGRMDLLPWNAIMELSKHCEEGALKYGEHNIDLGCAFHSLADSGSRHLAKWIAGIQDEPHLLAACWNLMWLLEETITKPELNDMFWADKQKPAKDTFDVSKRFSIYKRDVKNYDELMKACSVCHYYDPLRYACNHIGERDAFKKYTKGE